MYTICDLVGRDEWGWSTLVDRKRLTGVVFPDTYSDLSGYPTNHQRLSANLPYSIIQKQ